MSVTVVLDLLSNLRGEVMPKGVHKVNRLGLGIDTYVSEVQVVTHKP